MKDDDKRKHNGGHRAGHYRYGEPKKKHCLTLTDFAWAWLTELGGSDYIEQKARDKRPKKPLT